MLAMSLWGCGSSDRGWVMAILIVGGLGYTMGNGISETGRKRHDLSSFFLFSLFKCLAACAIMGSHISPHIFKINFHLFSRS